MADTSVKWVSSTMTGAPVLSGTAGSLVAVLNAALVDGFGLNSVDSIVIAASVATVTRTAGHPFEVGSVALVSGATTTTGSINGEQRVLSVTATSYTFDAAGIGNQTATGTISHKVAPLGWGRPYTGSSTVQAYRSADVAGTRLPLRVDDTGTVSARLVGYESMTDVNTGTGPFPTAAQASGGAHWMKSQTVSATARPWVVVGDGRSFAIYVAHDNVSLTTAYFGDYVGNKSPDPWACVLIAGSGTYSGASSVDAMYSSSTGQFVWAPRGVSGLGSAVVGSKFAIAPLNRDNQNSGSGGVLFPNPGDNGVYMCPMAYNDSGAYRGVIPGLYHCPQNVGPSVFALGDRVTGVTGLTGRALRALLNPAGVGFADTTGPWR